MAAKQWSDVCRGSTHTIPVNSGYCILSAGEMNVALPRPMTQLMGICHVVYHLLHYLQLAVMEANAQPGAGGIEDVWRSLCGPEHASQAVAQWKWTGAPAFVQHVVHLRAAVDAARAWVGGGK
jgi:hypothetical protein